jgi:hypothetical protein
MVVILGGAKEDKLKNIDKLAEMADWILVGGKLPKLIQNPSALRAPPLDDGSNYPTALTPYWN